MIKKKYYHAIKKRRNGEVVTHLWHLEPEKAQSRLSKSYDFIIPLERKPRNEFAYE